MTGVVGFVRLEENAEHVGIILGECGEVLFEIWRIGRPYGRSQQEALKGDAWQTYIVG